MIVIVKKEIYHKWKSFKMIREFKHKGIKYMLFKLYWKTRGYEVEEVDYDYPLE